MQAGLYSAVLTAFLVESYKALREDTRETIIFLLRQLVVQTNSFIANDRFINSTTGTLPDLEPSFPPSSHLTLVNSLWFASLTLSLTSASFSIVVKQWLLKLPVQEHIAPKTHLRIRHLRHAGLKLYKVFDIAAFLPLLLQVSLLLFFIGLCFYTADAYNRIRNATIVLVSLWGFFLIATTLIPGLDPRCPYKVPLLTEPISWLRRLILKFLRGGREHHTGISNHALIDPKSEDAISQDPSQDVKLLVEALQVDAIQANDALLKDIMFELTQDGTLDPRELSEVTFTVIDYRLRGPGPASDTLGHTFLDMRSLSRQTYDTIIYMITLLLQAWVDQHTVAHPGDVTATAWVQNSICALVSRSEHWYFNEETVEQVLSKCFIRLKDQYALSTESIFQSRLRNCDNDLLAAFCKRIKGALVLSDTASLVGTIQGLFEDIFTQTRSNLPPGTDTARSIYRTCADAPNRAEYKICNDFFHELLAPRIKDELKKKVDPESLLQIDAILLDDDTLLKDMWPTIISSTTYTQSAKFLLGALGNRLHRDVLDEVQTSFLDIAGLRPKYRETIMTMAKQFISDQSKHRSEWDEASGNIVAILLPDAGDSESSGPAPAEDDSRISALKVCLSKDHYLSTADVITSRIESEEPDIWAVELSGTLEKLADGLSLIGDDELLPFIQRLFEASPIQDSCQAKPIQETEPIRRITGETAKTGRRDNTYSLKLPKACQEVVFRLFIPRITQCGGFIGDGELEEFNPQSQAARLLSIIFQVAVDDGLTKWNEAIVVDLVRRLLTSKKDGDKGIICSVALNTLVCLKKARTVAQEYFIKAAVLITWDGKTNTLLRLMIIR